jgi:hypothetical protein
MSDQAVLRERTRYKYANAEEARVAKSLKTKESYLRNKEKNKQDKEYKEKYNEYQRKWRQNKKLEQEENNKLLDALLLANNNASRPIENNNLYFNQQGNILPIQMLTVQISNK